MQRNLRVCREITPAMVTETNSVLIFLKQIENIRKKVPVIKRLLTGSKIGTKRWNIYCSRYVIVYFS